MESPAPIPIHVVTGFLGSGKTSLINELVREPAFAGTAVLINEFGEVAIDHDLVARIEDGVVETSTGCVCCAATSDVTASLDALMDRAGRDDSPVIRRVIVETTGLADPAPVVTALLPPARPAARTALSSVVTLFDAIHGGMALDHHFEALKQVALADTIILTKTDLLKDPASRADLARDRARLATLNPAATVIDRQSAGGAIRSLFLGAGSYDVASRSKDALAWLAAERTGAFVHGRAENGEAGDRHDGVSSHCIVVDEPLDPKGFALFLEALKLSAGPKILRLKGLVALADDPARPLVVHGVHHSISPVMRLDRWPSDDRRTRLVVIGRELKVPAIERMLATLRPKKLV